MCAQSLKYSGGVTIELTTEQPTTCITLHSHELYWTAKDVDVAVNGTKRAVTEVNCRVRAGQASKGGGAH